MHFRLSYDYIYTYCFDGVVAAAKKFSFGRLSMGSHKNRLQLDN